MAFLISILGLALPMSVASTVMLLSVIINTVILGSLHHYNLYLLALFLPINYFQIALLEAFRAPALVMSAIYCQQKNSILFGKKIISLIMIAGAVILLSTLLFTLLQHELTTIFQIPSVLQSEFIIFTRNMLLLGILICANYIFNSVLYGINRPRIAMGLSLVTAIITCGLTYLLAVHYHFGITSLFYALTISNCSVGIAALIVLKHLGLFKRAGWLPGFAEHGQVMLQVVKIAAPIGGSYLILFFTLLVFNKILSYFDAATVAGFGVAYRLQAFIILPAVALGMAIAVLINRYVAAGEIVKAEKVLQTGVFFAFSFYLIITPLLYIWRINILALITHDVAVLQAADNYFSWIVFSYIGLGPLLVFLIMLDQTGSSLKSLFYSLLAFTLECGVGGVLALHVHKSVIFYQVVSCINLLSLLLVFFECFVRKKHFNYLKGVEYAENY